MRAIRLAGGHQAVCREPSLGNASERSLEGKGTDRCWRQRRRVSGAVEMAQNRVTHPGVDAVCTSRGAGPWSARLGFSPGTALHRGEAPCGVFGTRDRAKRVARAEPRAQKD